MEKYCKYCQTYRSEGEFQKARTINGKDYYRLKCTVCKNETQKKRMRNNKAQVDEIKKTLECGRCKNKDWRVLQFHHNEGHRKEFNIADRLDLSIGRIKEEMKKCTPLCANCHTILHWEQRNLSNVRNN